MALSDADFSSFLQGLQLPQQVAPQIAQPQMGIGDLLARISAGTTGAAGLQDYDKNQLAVQQNAASQPLFQQTAQTSQDPTESNLARLAAAYPAQYGPVLAQYQMNAPNIQSEIALRKQQTAVAAEGLQNHSNLAAFAKTQMQNNPDPTAGQLAGLVNADPALGGDYAQYIANAPKNRLAMALEARKLAMPMTEGASSGYQWTQDANGQMVQTPIPTGAGAINPVVAKQEADLRAEFDKQPGNDQFPIVKQAYDNIQLAAANPSPAGDQALIYGVMKLFNPASTVRPGQAADAENAVGVPDEIRGMFNKVLEGENLTPKARADYVQKSNELMQSYVKNYGANATKYRKLATDQGLNPDRVAQPYNLGSEKPPSSIHPDNIAKLVARAKGGK